VLVWENYVARREAGLQRGLDCPVVRREEDEGDV
jgi:hypothetical protein